MTYEIGAVSYSTTEIRTKIVHCDLKAAELACDEEFAGDYRDYELQVRSLDTGACVAFKYRGQWIEY